MWRIPQDENGRTSTLVTSTAQPRGSREDERISNVHKNPQDKTRQGLPKIQVRMVLDQFVEYKWQACTDHIHIFSLQLPFFTALTCIAIIHHHLNTCTHFLMAFQLQFFPLWILGPLNSHFIIRF